MPFTPGQDLTIGASEWNDLLVMRQQWLGSGRNPYLPTDPQKLAATGWCWIKNTTANALAFGDVLGIDEPIITLTQNAAEKYNGVRWKGIAPSTSTPHYGQYAILQEPAAAGAIVRAVMHGLTWCKLTITHASDIAAEITNGATSALTTGYVGTSRILWKESGTGSGKWGLIRVGDTLDNFVGKSDGTITTGSTGTVSIWDAGFAGDLGINVTGCYNHSATSLAAGDKVAGVILKGVPIVAKIC
jgi:hypothetical protein